MKVHAACVAFVLAVACQDEPTSWKDDYSFVWHGEYVSVYGYDRSPSEACGGSFAAIDTHSEAILALLGAVEPVHYDYRWMSAEFLEGRCRPGSAACTAYGEPWTASVPQMHEITHAVEYAAWDNACPSILMEGLAEYFSGPRFRADEVPDPSMVRDALSGAPIRVSEYADERVIGPMGGKAFTTRRVWFPEDTLLEVEVLRTDSSGEWGWYMIQECAPCSAEPHVYWNLTPVVDYTIRAGMYDFIFRFDLDQSAPLQVTIGPPV